MDLKSFHNIYFIGIGGIGMSAIARYLHTIGKYVSGYDKTSTTLTKKLESEGIDIHYEDDPLLIDQDADLVIYTPAIPGDHKEYNWFMNNGYPIIKRSEALGLISRESKTIAVAGTHGKTSTSSLMTQILKYGKIQFSAFVGGIILDTDSNYLSFGNEWVILEADEYDRSFLHLNPQVTILMSMDADHLDIYSDHDQMKEGFWEFVMKINDGGYFIYAKKLQKQFPLSWKEDLRLKEVTPISFGIEEGDVRAIGIRVVDGNFVFNYQWEDILIKDIILTMPGWHNVENCVAAITAAILTGVKEESVKKALAEFGGVHRRFEKLYDDGVIIYIDDYAHHPTELDAAISAARSIYPDKKITGIFQPHLFTRTRDFYKGFARSLEYLDEVILMDIYPARELPIPGVNSQMIMEEMSIDGVEHVKDEDIMDVLEAKDLEVLMTLGAGDIDLLRNKILEWLENKNR